MTETLVHDLPAGAASAPRTSRARLLTCWVAVATMVPYFSIKIAWLCGSTIGTNGERTVRLAGWIGVNALTLGMDSVALLTVLTLTYRWGMRVPAWLLVFPMWMATGFLGLITLSAPPAFLATALSGGHLVSGSDDLVHPWVYLVVYTGFTGQGIGLATAFVLHLRARWPELFRARIAGLARGATGGVLTVLAVGLGGLAALTALVHLYWAGGGTAGIPAPARGDRSLAGDIMQAVQGLLILAGVAGVLTLARRRERGQLLLPAVAAWLGTGCAFAWGLWGGVGLAIGSAQRPLRPITTPLDTLTILFQTLSGALLATVTLFLLLDAWAAIRSAGIRGAADSGGAIPARPGR